MAGVRRDGRIGGVVSNGAGGDGGRGGGAGDGGTAARRRWRQCRGQINGRQRWRRGLLDEDEDELPDPGLLRTYIGADPLAPVRGWNRC